MRLATIVAILFILSVGIGAVICKPSELPAEPLPDFVPHEVLAAQPQAVNLADGLKPEAQRIIQLLKNVPGGFPSFVYEGNSVPPTYTWPDRTTVVYSFPTERAGQRYINLTLSNIQVTNFSPLSWDDATVTNSDTVSQVITTVTIPADTKFKRTFEYHFGAVETLQDSTTTALEQEATVKLGVEYSPVNIDIAEKVKTETTKTFGQEKTFETTDTQEIEFEAKDTPRTIKIEAIRDRQQLRRAVSTRPVVDYRICISTRYEQTAEACWANKEEFLAFLAGATPDDVGAIQYNYHGRNTQRVQTWQNYRASPQPGAETGQTLPIIQFPADYTTILNQTIVAKEVTE